MSQIPEKILDELCSRFIINLPLEKRQDRVGLFFAIELAHWHFIDYYCEENHLPECELKEFAQQIFQHCPFLRDDLNHLDEIFSRWRNYKFSVPTYGAILLDPTLKFLLLVRGFYSRESWGFPKGKVQENESSMKCAIREVMEEVGFDIKDRIFPDQYLERIFNRQITRLYIVKNVPLETKFVSKTNNEIKDMQWFRIDDLPTHRRDANSATRLKINPKAFSMIIPFLKDLYQWIDREEQKNFRRRTKTFHDEPNSPKTEIDASKLTELTPPLSNDEENVEHQKQRRRKKKEKDLKTSTFSYLGPRCWTQFRLNRHEIVRCLENSFVHIDIR